VRGLLQIFKPGKHVASDGTVHDFSAARLRGCVDAYDPALCEAPLVIGHPATNDPAYGWVKALTFGETLDALPHQVNPEFAQMVNDGAFKKMSASFYLEDAPGNPKPGTLYLRHIGFLGAKAPAINGLKSASFASPDMKGVIEFTDWNGVSIAGLFRRLKNYLIDAAGQEKADAVLPEWELENLTLTAAKKEDAAASFNQAEGGTTEMNAAEIARREAQLKTDQENFARERAEFSQRAAEQRAATILSECTAVIDALVAEGKVLPAQRAGLIAFMAALPAEGVVEFAAAEGQDKVKKPSAEWFRDYLKAQPKVVEFAEHGHRGRAPIELDAQALADKAVEFMESERKAGREITVTAAVSHVKAQQ
jgi:hypothetical protein